MKKRIKTFRIREDIDNGLSELSSRLNISTSQLIELACIKILESNEVLLKKEKKEYKVLNNSVSLKLNVDTPTFKILIYEINKKNSTLTQEILFRLSASLNNPVFDSKEYKQLWSLQVDLNRIGNLIKLAINQKIPFDNDLLISTKESVNNINYELREILNETRKRTFKGALK